MPEIVLHSNKDTVIIQAEKGKSLLQVIRENGFEIFAPCGGNGTCGKCRVNIKNEGAVSSCVYYPEKNIEVFMPDSKESQILTKQYEYSTKVTPYPGESMMRASYPLGVAIDIGTSTLVFYLVNLITGSIAQTRGRINPQAKYGADVISRIQHCGQNKGLPELQKEIIEVINEELERFANESGVAPDQIVKITIAGNTTMLHILLGVDPTPIAMAPFTPQFTDKKIMRGSELKLSANEEAELIILPSISAYVGADIVAGLASLSPPEEIKNYLFIDIGTNGEMALVSPGKILCCAAAAGPAFEGANISCGMGAFSGAISEFTNPSDFKTISGEEAIGVCGSGLIDIVAYLLDNKLTKPDGLMDKDFIINAKTDKHPGLALLQKDIREVQLAKSAIMAGINILVKSAGLDISDIDALFLAGGFGNYINSRNAVKIGLLPEALKEKIIPIGNTSGTGAVLSLKSILFDANIERVLQESEYIELSTHDDFVLEYAMNMGF